ncbi:GYD domain-containing protein [Candidatus Bipolaricaulota bacterium]|nr:GYD domain-containing protein [Candidatus Bipolaricaulota bacterium]
MDPRPGERQPDRVRDEAWLSQEWQNRGHLDGLRWIKEVNREIEASFGAKVLHQYATLGPYDFVNIVEAPDAAAIAWVSSLGWSLTGGRGNMRGWQVWAVFLGILCLSGWAQTAPPSDPAAEVDRLPWSTTRPLTWDDFRGPPPQDTAGRAQAAQLHLALTYSLQYELWFDRASGMWRARIASLAVTNVMDKTKSWVYPDKKTDVLLNHEQKHFDLGEVYRRVLERSLWRAAGEGATREAAEQDLNTKIGDTSRQILDVHARVQDQYDRETDHGRHAEKQAEWDKRIAEWLADPAKAP